MATYPLRKTKYVVRQDFELSLNVLDDGRATINMTYFDHCELSLVISDTVTQEESISTLRWQEGKVPVQFMTSWTGACLSFQNDENTYSFYNTMCGKLKMMDCVQIIVIFKLDFTSWKCTYTYNTLNKGIFCQKINACPIWNIYCNHLISPFCDMIFPKLKTPVNDLIWNLFK